MIFSSGSIHEFLSAELRRRIGVNPRYSLRAYARSLGISAGELSEILRQRRGLSLASAIKIAKAMGLSSTETRQLLHLAQLEKSRRIGAAEALEATVQPLEQKQLSEDTFALVSEWYHFAILNLMDCQGFKWNSKWIARRLGLEPAQVRMAMDLLVRMGLVKKSNGRVAGVKDFVLSPAGIPSTAIRNYHRQIFEKAAQALELQSVSEREVSGVGFAVDVRALPAIKKEISDFQDQLVAKHSKGKRHEVYFLEIAFFKLTQGSNHEN